MAWFRHALALSVFGVLGYYEWRRLVRAPRLRGRVRAAASAGVVALVAPVVLVTVRSPSAPPTVQGWIAWPVYLGWAVFALIFGGLVAVDAGRLVVGVAWWVVSRRPLPRVRRVAIARSAAAAVTSLAVAEVGAGMALALRAVPVVDVPVALARLPRALDGFTIVQLTDLHVGGTVGRGLVEQLVARTNALAPDAIVLTGDLVDGTVSELAHALAPLGGLRAPHGVYAVTGNHEYYFGVEDWLAYLGELGVRVLRNERVAIGRGEDAFELAGVDDHSAAGYGRGHGADVRAALAGRDPRRAVVLLAHQPRQVRATEGLDVDLVLSGHTHGGQAWPWHVLVALQQRGLVAGRYRFGATQLYVSRGAGYWGPPVRFGAPAELTRIVLRAVRSS